MENLTYCKKKIPPHTLTWHRGRSVCVSHPLVFPLSVFRFSIKVYKIINTVC
jgi:hypothetical protein